VVTLKVYAALTFDDGYLSHYYIAEFLFKEKIKGTFFVVTYLKHFEGKPLLTLHPELIRAISDLDHEIGSHSCTHVALTSLSYRQVEQEVSESRYYLEKILNKKVKGFAYPHGFYNKDVISKVARYYEYARLAGKRFEAKTWNSCIRSHYLIEGIGYKELLKLPMKYIIYRHIKPVVVFHNDPLYIVKAVIRYLRCWNVEFVTLSELLERA
jgi:peptidoglycan/xylan/chitin deacetylase (PgdA/CDA1 family)